MALTLFRLGFLRVAQLGGGGGGRQKVPAAYNSKTVNDNEMINKIKFWVFTKISPIKEEKFRNAFELKKRQINGTK